MISSRKKIIGNEIYEAIIFNKFKVYIVRFDIKELGLKNKKSYYN